MSTEKKLENLDDYLTVSTGTVDAIDYSVTEYIPTYRDFNMELAKVLHLVPIHIAKKFLERSSYNYMNVASDKDGDAMNLVRDITEENQKSTLKRLKILGW